MPASEYTGLPPRCLEPDLPAGEALACAIAAAGTPEGRRQMEAAERTRAANRAAARELKLRVLADLVTGLREAQDALTSRLGGGKWKLPKCADGATDSYRKRSAHGVYTYDFDCNDPASLRKYVWMQDLYDQARSKIRTAAAQEPEPAQRAEYVNAILAWAAVANAALGLHPWFAPAPDDRGLTAALATAASNSGYVLYSPVDPRRVLQYTRLGPAHGTEASGGTGASGTGTLSSDWAPLRDKDARGQYIYGRFNARYGWPSSYESTLRFPLGDQSAKISNASAIGLSAALIGGAADAAVVTDPTLVKFTKDKWQDTFNALMQATSGGGAGSTPRTTAVRYRGVMLPTGAATVEIARRYAQSIVALEFEDTLLASFEKYCEYLKAWPPELVGMTAAEINKLYADARKAREMQKVARARAGISAGAEVGGYGWATAVMWDLQDAVMAILEKVLPMARGVACPTPVPFLSRCSSRRGCKIAPADVGLEESFRRIESMATRVDYTRFATRVREERERLFPGEQQQAPPQEEPTAAWVGPVLAILGGAAAGLVGAKIVVKLRAR